MINFNDVTEKRSNSSTCIETTYVVCINKHYDNGLKIYTYISSFLLRLGPIVFLSVMTVLIIVRFNKLVRRRKEHMKTHVSQVHEGIKPKKRPNTHLCTVCGEKYASPSSLR